MISQVFFLSLVRPVSRHLQRIFWIEERIASLIASHAHAPTELLALLFSAVEIFFVCNAIEELSDGSSRTEASRLTNHFPPASVLAKRGGVKVVLGATSAAAYPVAADLTP